MAQPNAADLALLRTQPHRTKLYLSIYRPNTVLACQVNDGSIAKGERVITYNNVSEGSYLQLYRGMTMYVGTSAGGKDLGEIYVRRATSTTITVGENSHINWSDDLYLTVVNFFQIWPTYPRYISDEDDITVYKDYDVPYNNHNETLGSFVCMGSHHAGFLDGGSHDVYFSATGTVHVGGDSLYYHWLFPGGTPTGSNVHTPGNVTYDTPGHYSARLYVSGTSTGAVDVGHRHISIYDRPEEGTNTPILSWGTDSDLSGDRSAGGYSVDLWVKENIDYVEDGALVIIFSENWYGSTKTNIIGGLTDNRTGIIFTGYVLGDTISYDYQVSKVTFKASSPTELMKQVEAFSVSVEDSTDPEADANIKGADPWFYLVGLSMKTALYHYQRWHTTLNLCCDIQYDGDDFNLQYFDANRSSLYNALNSLMETAVMGKTVSDRYGKIWFEIEYEALGSPLNLQQDMFLDNQDWIGELDIQERRVSDLSFLEIGGVYWQGAVANAFTPLISAAPGQVPSYRGSPIRLTGLALSGQAQVNTMCGNVYANRNARFPEVSVELSGNYSNFDIAPQSSIALTAQNKTFRQLNWVQKKFAIRRISWKLDTEKQFANPTLSVAEIVAGFAGDTVDIPEVPPGDGYTKPIIPTPPLPVFPIIDIGGGGSTTPTLAKAWIESDATVSADGYVSFASRFEWCEINITATATGLTIPRDGTYLILYGGRFIVGTGFTSDPVWGRLELHVDLSEWHATAWRGYGNDDAFEEQRNPLRGSIVLTLEAGDAISLYVDLSTSNILTTMDELFLQIVEIQ